MPKFCITSISAGDEGLWITAQTPMGEILFNLSPHDHSDKLYLSIDIPAEVHLTTNDREWDEVIPAHTAIKRNTMAYVGFDIVPGRVIEPEKPVEPVQQLVDAGILVEAEPIKTVEQFIIAEEDCWLSDEDLANAPKIEDLKVGQKILINGDDPATITGFGEKDSIFGDESNFVYFIYAWGEQGKSPLSFVQPEPMEARHDLIPPNEIKLPF